MIYFFIIGPVSYPVAVVIRSSYFCALLMFDATIITICLFRQLLILKVTIQNKIIIFIIHQYEIMLFSARLVLQFKSREMFSYHSYPNCVPLQYVCVK